MDARYTLQGICLGRPRRVLRCPAHRACRARTQKRLPGIPGEPFLPVGKSLDAGDSQLLVTHRLHGAGPDGELVNHRGQGAGVLLGRLELGEVLEVGEQ